jgi:hypothetical protein
MEKHGAESGFWRILTTRETLNSNQANFWAIVETLSANVAFWYIAIRWETFVPLYSALFIAPMLLMRSKKSINIAIHWFINGLIRDNPFNRGRSRFYGREFGAFIIFYVLVLTLLLIVDIFSNYTILTTVLIALIIPIVAATFCLSITMILYGDVIFDSLVIDLTNLKMARTGAIYKTAIRTVISSCMFVGAILAIFLSSTVFKIVSTIYYAREGYESMPRNIRRLAIQIGPTHQPELIPELDKRNPKYSLKFIFNDNGDKSIKQGIIIHIFFYIFLGVIILLWYVPAFVYRIVLKSTFWLWWILFFVGGGPDTHSGVRGLRADAYVKFGSWIYISIAIFGILAFLANFAVSPVIENIYSSAPLPGAIILLFQIEFWRLSIFQALSMITALMTLYIVKKANELWVDYGDSERRKTVEGKIYGLNVMVKLKTAAGCMWIALLMLYVALYANSTHNWTPLSSWVEGWLQSVYGPNAAALSLPQVSP